MTAVVILAGLNGGPATASLPLNTTPPTRAESRAIALRAQFGLQNDLSYVRAAESAATSSATVDLGIPLTPAEHAEMARRDRLGSAMASIEKTFTGADPTYVGVWLDQASGGILNVSFTADPSPQTAAQLQELLPAGASARVTVVPTPLATLTAVAAQITQDMIQNGQHNDLTIVSSGVDVSTDSVTVTILNSAPIGEEAALLARYGPTLTITRGEQFIAL